MPAARMRALAALTRHRVNRNLETPAGRDGPGLLPRLPKVRVGRNRREDASHDDSRLWNWAAPSIGRFYPVAAGSAGGHLGHDLCAYDRCAGAIMSGFLAELARALTLAVPLMLLLHYILSGGHWT